MSSEWKDLHINWNKKHNNIIRHFIILTCYAQHEFNNSLRLTCVKNFNKHNQILIIRLSGAGTNTIELLGVLLDIVTVVYFSTVM